MIFMRIIKIVCLFLITSLSVYANESEPDPFDSPQKSDAVANKSTFATRMDLIYQGTYIPDLLGIKNNNLNEHYAVIDTLATWSATETAKFQARGLINYREKRIGQNSEHDADAIPLEYFYAQEWGEHNHYFFLGRKNLGWSAGFQWRPADLINNGFTTKNVDFVDPTRYRGIDQIQYETIGNVYDFVALLSNHEDKFFHGKQFAIKLDLKGGADISLLYGKSGTYSNKYGFTINKNLPWAMTFVLEAIHVEIDKEKLVDPFYFGNTLESLSGIHRYEDVYFNVTKYIDEKRRFNFEYFHNGRGFKTDEFESTRSIQNFMKNSLESASINSRIFEEEYLGRNYLYAAYTGYIDTYKLQIKPSVLMNTDDGSNITSVAFKRDFFGNSELSLNVNVFNGDTKSDFGSISPGIGFSMSYILHIF